MRPRRKPRARRRPAAPARRRSASEARAPRSAAEAQRLLRGFVDHLLEHGLATSLRPAAAAIGTSPRMLLHYFGSKDELLVAAMNEFAARRQRLVAEELDRHPVRDAHHHLMAFWRSFAPKGREPFLLLLLEMWVASLRNPRRLRGFLDGTRGYWQLAVDMLCDSGLGRDQAEVSATVYLAAMRGLMLDLLGTGERARVEAAAARIAALIESEVAAAQAGASVAVRGPRRGDG